MNLVIRCTPPTKGENPEPRMLSLVVLSKATGEVVYGPASEAMVVNFLVERAEERERSLRAKEVQALREACKLKSPEAFDHRAHLLGRAKPSAARHARAVAPREKLDPTPSAASRSARRRRAKPS